MVGEIATATRHAPCPVFSACLKNVGPEPPHGNWFPDAPFTDSVASVSSFAGAVTAARAAAEAARRHLVA